MAHTLNTHAINACAAQIIGNLQEESLAVHCFLQKQWQSQSVIENKLFQFVFRSFYRLDNAGLTHEFKDRYFAILEDTRQNPPDIRAICKTLYEIRTLKGLTSLQFSFVTKLANTANPQLPIYDSEVARVYGYKAPASSRPLDKRLDHLLAFHTELATDYTHILDNGLLAASLQQFDQQFPAYAQKIEERRKLDFIVWSAGKLGVK